MPRFLRPFFLVMGLGLATAGCRHAPSSLPDNILPLERVRLYETGVAYFERSGRVAVDESVSLPVPASHLDDALKTLTVFGQDGKAVVHGVEFGSSVSKGMGRALAGLPLDDEGPIRQRELLASLKGASLALGTTNGRFRGRLIDVFSYAEEKAKKSDESESSDASTEKKSSRAEKEPGSDEDPGLVLLILDEGGAIHRISAKTLLWVQPRDPTIATRLDTALDALARSGAQSRKLLRLLASAAGPVTLGYIAEAPLWRTTYRLVFDEKRERGTLQGWALIHNDSDESWSAVKVELVSGRPDSFLFPLAAPRYLRRELVHPEDPLATVPQLLNTTVDTIWGDQLGDAYGAGGLGVIGTGGGGGGSGSGYGHGYGRLGSRSAAEASDVLRVGNLASLVPARGVEAGALFSYSLPKPIDLRAHGSALVPFLDETVDSEAVASIHETSSTVRSALRLVNSTRQTLATGPLSIFDGGRFAGETVLDRLKPGERRFLEYGVDLDVEVELKRESYPDETKRVVVKDQQLEEHYLARRKLDCTFTNRSLQPRQLHLSLDLRQNAEILGADSLDYDTERKRPMAKFKLPAQQKVQRQLTTTEGLVRKTYLSALQSTVLEKLEAVSTLGDKERAALRDGVARKKEVEASAKRLEELKVEVTSTDKDIERLREHLKAAGGKEQGVAPIVKRLLAAEDQLAGLKAKIKATGEELARREKGFEKALDPLKAPDLTPPKSPSASPR